MRRRDSTPETPMDEEPGASPLEWGEEITEMKWQQRWEDSKGMLLILCSETFGTLMAAGTRLLEMGDGGMTVLQIMFVRFGITLVLSSLYMWAASVPDFPFGKPEVRRLLLLRGFGGFVGVFGFYYSLKYLPIAEAILLGFTTPIFTAYACSLFLHAPFERKQLVAGLVSFLGVVLIAQPDALSQLVNSGRPSNEVPEQEGGPSAAERLTAVLLGLLGVLGATCAYTTIRVIGVRAHPLLSVSYYAFIATLISGVLIFLPIFPEITFRLPSSSREWGLLIGLGISGFLLQSLMTAGLVRDKSSRATNMMYSSVVFGLGLDYAIWGLVPGWTSWLGGIIVVTATLWGAMQGEVQKDGGVRDEEYAMVDGDDNLDELDEEDDENEEQMDRDDGEVVDAKPRQTQ